MATYEVGIIIRKSITVVASNEGDVYEEVMGYIDSFPRFDNDDRNYWNLDDIEIIEM